MAGGTQHLGPPGGAGPTNPTPLAEAFYKAWVASGLTMEAIAKRTDLSVPTVSAYINGTRGGGGQMRQRPTITAIAKVLRMDVDKTLALAGLAKESGVVEAIRADPTLSRRDREFMIDWYERAKRR